MLSNAMEALEERLVAEDCWISPLRTECRPSRYSAIGDVRFFADVVRWPKSMTLWPML